MSYLSIIALLFGALGVWLTIKQTILCWPVSLIAVIASLIEFYNQRLFGDMSLQVFYFFAGVYGWIYWNQKSRETFNVIDMPSSQILPLMIVTLLQVFVYYSLLKYYNGDKPLVDAILTACSLTATFMMTKKYVQNWAAWVFIDFAYILLYISKNMWIFAVLYLIFTLLAFYGWRKWKNMVI